MIGSDQFVLAVIWLASGDRLLAISGALGQFVWPVHPVHASIHMVLISGSDLEDARDPIDLVSNLPAVMTACSMPDGYGRYSKTSKLNRT